MLVTDIVLLPLRVAVSVCLFVMSSLFAPTRLRERKTLFSQVEQRGYRIATHQVVTRDGYELSVFRMQAPGKNGQHRMDAGRPVALLWHGLLDSAFTWVFRDTSLAFALADAGYDVWLANNRGNVYAGKHMYLSPSSAAFWDFTYDEFAEYDLPDTIDYVLRSTKQSSLSYVGHSEGTTQFFAGLSERPAIASHINCFVGLGPVATVGTVTDTFLRVIAAARLDVILWACGIHKSFMGHENLVMRTTQRALLYVFPGFANAILALLCGKPEDKFNRDTATTFAANEPGGTSMRNLLHWCQAVRNARFQKYDYGKALNKAKYGTPTPPTYPLTDIPKSLPKLLFYGSEDALVDKQDVTFLATQLRNTARGSTHDDPKLTVKRVEGFNHTDYLWAAEAAEILYPEVVAFLDRHSGLAPANRRA